MDRTARARDLTTLADPTRARILRLIRESDSGRMLVGRLAETLELRQPTVSHHMKALHDEGLVVREPDGRKVWYSIAPDHFERIDALLGGAPTSAAKPDLDRITKDLVVRFRGTFSPESIRAKVVESYELLAGGSQSPMLASRTAAFVATRLAAMSRAAALPDGIPTVLFVCVQNAGRSQLAAGILRQLAGERVRVLTAGSQPASDVRHTVTSALDEIGVPLGGEFPKPLTDEAVRAADVVVTMGCGDACPIYAGRRYLDWDLEDPVGKPIEQVRAIRDDIEARVRRLLSELVTEGSAAVPSN
ncbi:metalloregulator ArsR/SmtB family transcription factor [Microbacterium sp. CFH 90308]|uniref:Metalloregulator ArsR/SmtB family transcription factor n=1 Tax=Microbacterium salsuginis TaxID=2722803 RepID=A0ABX1K772_9MICO|nr:metalloregulator ArsR/SmtB family transcription factor [Microbacterium sp. CFH 90308]NLP82759.1 metalloregulator ArsR/SmtB family transcription factor [Microbacterium sp. CFH 90308]